MEKTHDLNHSAAPKQSMYHLFVQLFESYRPGFSQYRVYISALQLAIVVLASLGRKSITRLIAVSGNYCRDWTKFYRLFSVNRVDVTAMATKNLQFVLTLLTRENQRDLDLAYDDTSFKKTGKQIPGASWGRDPLSPPFHVNLRWQVRYAIGSVVLGLHHAIPIIFASHMQMKKPGKRASHATHELYRSMVKEYSPARILLRALWQLKSMLNSLGEYTRMVYLLVDGSYCNKTVFKGIMPEHMQVIARCRKDAKLCLPSSDGRRVFDSLKFTPDTVLHDPAILFQTARVFVAGAYRTIRYKEVSPVLWQRGAGKKPLRLITIAPIPYRRTKHGRRLYRQSAFLLTTDCASSASIVLRKYTGRWKIEINHREMKSTLQIAHAQVWSRKSVYTYPAFCTMVYGLFKITELLGNFSATRPADSRCAWDKKTKTRASFNDVLSLFRCEVACDQNGSALIPDFARNVMLFGFCAIL